MNIRPLSLIFIVALISSCNQTITKETSSSTSPVNDTYPAWVLNPQIDGFIAVSASAPKQNMGGDYAQRRVALAKARQQLAEQIRVRVKAESIDSIKDENGKISISQSMQAKIHARVMMNMGNAKILNEWIEPGSGDLYIHYVTNAINGI